MEDAMIKDAFRAFENMVGAGVVYDPHSAS